jgi:BirA family biotin operon repressor/biotin-[acetyl-CoA-carboxylase] ligase
MPNRSDLFDSPPVGMATPYSLQVREEVTSTQDLAAAAFNGSPVLVAAARQTEGRGRSLKDWLSAPRAMAASLAFAPAWPLAHWPSIPLVAGLAAAEILGGDVFLKWPNDLLMGESKVGGVLVEASSSEVVVGCGINLWWPDPPHGAVGLVAEDPGSDRFILVAKAWAERFLERMERSPGDWGRAEYLARCVTIGKEITWEPGGIGTAVDVDEEGALVVDIAGGRTRLLAGEVRHIRGRRRKTEDGS